MPVIWLTMVMLLVFIALNGLELLYRGFFLKLLSRAFV